MIDANGVCSLCLKDAKVLRDFSILRDDTPPGAAYVVANVCRCNVLPGTPAAALAPGAATCAAPSITVIATRSIRP